MKKTKVVVVFKLQLEDKPLVQKTELFEPFVAIGFGENVWYVDRESGRIRLPLSHLLNDGTEISLSGYYNAESDEPVSLLMSIEEPVLGTDNLVAYHRASDTILACGNDFVNKSGDVENICGTKVARYKLMMHHIEPTSFRKSMLDVTSLSSLVTYQKQYVADMRDWHKHMFECYPGISTMLLFNNYFSSYGSLPFYAFAASRIYYSTPEYWQRLFAHTLNMYNISEEIYKSDLDQVWAALDEQTRMCLAIDMFCIPSNASLYLRDQTTDYISSIGTRISDKSIIKYLEDFCPLHLSWSGDCEDDAQMIIYMIRAFLAAPFDKKLHKHLWELQRMIACFIPLFALCGVSAASVESKEYIPSAHLCVILMKRSVWVKATRIMKNDDDNLAFFRTFVEHAPHEPDTVKELNAVYMCEGTTSLRAVPQKDRYAIEFSQAPPYIKHRRIIEYGKHSFYKYILEVLTNEMIDSDMLPVQSFVLSSERTSNSYMYGIPFPILMDNPEKLVLIATPSIDKNILRLCKTMSCVKLPFPQCHVVDGKVVLRFATDFGTPIASSTQIKNILATYGAPKFLRDKHYRYLIVPPRMMEVVDSVVREGCARIVGVECLWVFSDLPLLVVWVVMTDTENRAFFGF